MLFQRKIKIALTGGIGTGKTYISKQFLDIGIPFFYADEETKKLYNSPKVKVLLKNHFQNKFFTDNKLDYSKIADFIFLNNKNKKQFEKIIHPLVMQQFEEWADQQISPIVMMESAIIFEAELTHYFDKIFVVDAPLSVRMKRLQDRLSETEIRQRILSQMPQEEKSKRADLVIWNP